MYISTEGDESTEPVDSCLFYCPYNYYNVSVRPVVSPQFLGRYFNASNSIDNNNGVWNSGLGIEKYWVTQSVYFRHATVVLLGMALTDGKLFSIVKLQREARTSNFQQEITTTGRFVTASMIHFQIMVVYQS